LTFHHENPQNRTGNDRFSACALADDRLMVPVCDRWATPTAQLPTLGLFNLEQ
jgi:hypothetical protein